MTDNNEVPRRFRIDQNVPAELAIRAAMDAVEAMPADVRLTEAVISLGEALEHVADFVDGKQATPENRTDRCIGAWHDDCRPNRHQAADEIRKSQARIDQLADTVKALRERASLLATLGLI